MRSLTAPALLGSRKGSALHKDSIYSIENCTGVAIDFRVVHAMQVQVKTVEISCTPFIVAQFGIRAVRRAVNFDDKTSVMAEKIDHIGSDWHLPVKLETCK